MIKCHICGDKFSELEDLYSHIEEEHIESVPKNFTIPQYVYSIKTGKIRSSCIICHKPTRWNESTNKYNRFCDNPKCKDKYREEFSKRMIGKYGKLHLLDDPGQQRIMLANRKISGTYDWSNGCKKTYTGSYELDLLKVLDIFLNFDSDDVMTPSPHTYFYEYEGEKKFYIPDAFIPSLGLEIEVKDGGDNENKMPKIQAVDKVKEKLKDEVLMSQKEFSYIKIVNKEYDTLFDFLYRMKKQYAQVENERELQPIFIVNESLNNINNKFILPIENLKDADNLIINTHLTNILYSSIPIIGLELLIDAILKFFPFASTYSALNLFSQFNAIDILGYNIKSHKTYKIENEKKLNNYYIYGTNVIAIDDGEIIDVKTELNDNNNSRAPGNYIIIKHNELCYSLYCHLQKQNKIKKGDLIKQGNIIGQVGNTGNSSEPHLHFQVCYLNPTAIGLNNALLIAPILTSSPLDNFKDFDISIINKSLPDISFKNLISNYKYFFNELEKIDNINYKKSMDGKLYPFCFIKNNRENIINESNLSVGKCAQCFALRDWDDDGKPCPECGYEYIIPLDVEFKSLEEGTSLILNNINIILSNRKNYLEVVSSFKNIKIQMNELLEKAKTKEDIYYLKNDVKIVKSYLDTLSKTTPHLKDAIKEYKDWLNNIYLIKLDNKLQEIKNRNIIYENTLIEFKRNYPIIYPTAKENIPKGTDLGLAFRYKTNEGDFFHNFEYSSIAGCAEYKKKGNIDLVPIDDKIETYHFITNTDIKQGEKIYVSWVDYNKYFGDRYDYFSESFEEIEYDNEIIEEALFKDLHVYGKEEDEKIDKTYKRSDRYKIKFTLRNMDLLFRNIFVNAQRTGNFEAIRPNLLKLVDRCQTLDELGYLRRDKNAGKVIIKKLSENKPELKEKCLSHIKWLDNEYSEAINKKAKELREQTIEESTEIIGKNFIMNDNDLYYNFDSWKKGQNNVLFITGLSGSGKSTLAEELSNEYKAELIPLDTLSLCLSKGGPLRETNEDYNKYIDEYIIQYKNLPTFNWTDDELGRIETEKFMNWILPRLKSKQNELFIIEGSHIYASLPNMMDYFKDKPIIIKGTSLLTSIIRRYNRRLGFKKNGKLISNPLESILKELQSLPHMVYHSNELNKWKNNITKESTEIILEATSKINNQIRDLLDDAPNIYLGSDWHLYKFKNGIENRNPNADIYIQNQINTVKDNDVYIYLGDFAYDEFNNKEALKNDLINLKGKKILVMGNNDRLSEKFYISCGFDIVVKDYFIYRSIIFTHKPVEDFKGAKINVHGHIHFERKYWEVPFISHIDAFTGAYDNKPVLLTTLLSNLKNGTYKPIETIDKDSKFDIRKSNIFSRGTFARVNIKKDENVGLAIVKIRFTGNNDLDYERTLLGKYTNHSNEPNLKIIKNNGNYYYKAIKNINKDEELTIDYSQFDFEGKGDFINESLNNINYNLFHISQHNLDNKTLNPSIPNNYMTKNNYEDNKTARVSFFTSIDGCLRGISQKCKDIEFYVHIPIIDKDTKIKHITNKDVPDASITEEVWITTPVKVKCIGLIKIIDDKGEAGISYKYGDKTAELYD
jgi:murein DD-endopeptidase MepM/ murein hydrolase activator NlpD/calcineurin-like phosphoesterase family protein/uridine kinase